MINYAGGFVHRGLSGEILRFLWEDLGIHPALAAVVISIASFVAFVAYILHASKDLVPGWAVFSTGLAGAPLFTGNIIRKDVLLLLLFILLVKTLKSEARFVSRFFAVNSIFCLGLLLHEVFAFMALAATVVIFILNELRLRECPKGRATDARFILQKAIAGFIFCLPAFIVLCVILVSHGSFVTANVIHESWRSAWAGAQA